MDELLFEKQLGSCRMKKEDVSWLEILNYSDTEMSTAEHSSKLGTTDMFMSFLKREIPFAPRELAADVRLQDGIRLILQTKAENAEAFAPGVISLEATSYRALIREFHLSFRCLDSASAVGPCFWWAHVGGNLEIIFRKSDVEWKGNSRGWKMMLSYSFDTGLTSGYVKAMEKMNFKDVLDDLVLCGKPVSHPLLLVVLTLCNELSSKNDMEQRIQRRELRRLYDTLTARYTMAPAAHYGPETDPELDDLSKRIAVCQSKVLQKRAQAWQNIVDNVRKAATDFWDHMAPERKSDELSSMHESLKNRLDFLTVKLQGIENYAHVTLERLSLLRELLHHIISQRESRLNLQIAFQQKRLANNSGSESASMKTLTLIGSFFLPGTFLSSIFSMPFFDFSSEMDGHVSRSLWIYFVVSTPLTLIVFGLWHMFDRNARKKRDTDAEDGQHEENEMSKMEARIMRSLRRRTGIKVADTFPGAGTTTEQT